jgi:cyclic pyranopterin phosphate synthase
LAWTGCGLPELVVLLAVLPGVRDLSMTTNGVRLGRHAAALRAGGLHRLNISLDTLRPQRFMALSRRDDHAAVLAGIGAAGAAALKADPYLEMHTRGG